MGSSSSASFRKGIIICRQGRWGVGVVTGFHGIGKGFHPLGEATQLSCQSVPRFRMQAGRPVVLMAQALNLTLERFGPAISLLEIIDQDQL